MLSTCHQYNTPHCESSAQSLPRTHTLFSQIPSFLKKFVPFSFPVIFSQQPNNDSPRLRNCWLKMKIPKLGFGFKDRKNEKDLNEQASGRA
uniref:Aldehyde dehydrogenase n=1 Tax=Rhizophora mucronata TaxID=61149 RepID=A0A2P2KPA0_RHIMU